MHNTAAMLGDMETARHKLHHGSSTASSQAVEAKGKGFLLGEYNTQFKALYTSHVYTMTELLGK